MEYVCLLDESETSDGARDAFFVYGAMLIPVGKLGTLHEKIEEIRSRAGLSSTRSLKWNMRPGHGLDRATLENAKQSVLQELGACDGRLFTSIVLRQIAVAKKLGGKAHLFGANTVLEAVGKYLKERDSRAIFLFDRFPMMKTDDAYQYLGLRMARGLGRLDQPPSLPHSIGFGFICDDSTRIGSAMDVSLGAFVRCVSDLDKAAPPALGTLLGPLMARNSIGQTYGWGVRIRPTEVATPEYREPYKRMSARLRGLGLLTP
jgi:hypothetical protein